MTTPVLGTRPTHSTTGDPLAPLGELCGGDVHLPGDPGYDAARMPWNVAIDQRPAAVAYPATTQEVVEVVQAAAAAGLRVAPQGTGHNAGPLGALDDVVLLRTSAMTAVSIDPEAGVARVQAGTLWLDVVEAAARHGLTVLHGSSPDVGVVGYSLGGGMGWYARKLGLQTNAVTGAEVVTADGAIRRVDAQTDPELFWALRGGGGNVGIVTELEFRCYEFTTAYAGMIVFDISRADEVLRRYAEWAPTAPDEVTTSFRFLQLPPLETVPEPLRGRRVVVIDGAVMGDDDTVAEAVLAPLRGLDPEIDTFARVPTETLVRLHMDPEEPVPVVSRTATLSGLPAAAVAALLDAAGPQAQTSLLMVELRQLGGALGRPAPAAGALPCLDGSYVLFAGTMALDAESAAVGERDAAAVCAAMAPWSTDRLYLNFTEQATDTARGFAPADYERLVAVRRAVDPHGLFVANHTVRSTTNDSVR